jgi:hypothetical protein
LRIDKAYKRVGSATGPRGSIRLGPCFGVGLGAVEGGLLADGSAAAPTEPSREPSEVTAASLPPPRPGGEPGRRDGGSGGEGEGDGGGDVDAGDVDAGEDAAASAAGAPSVPGTDAAGVPNGRRIHTTRHRPTTSPADIAPSILLRDVDGPPCAVQFGIVTPG